MINKAKKERNDQPALFPNWAYFEGKKKENHKKKKENNLSYICNYISTL